jgi:hypothetical protein
MSAPEPSAGSDEVDTLRRLVEMPELFREIAAERGTEFQIQARLRERYPADLVRMALEIADLRRRAAGKFSAASRMWFARQGLEQATPELVARHKAARFAAASGSDPVWDLCCGIGGDALAMAAVRDVIAVDADPAQTLRTELNAAACGVAGVTVCPSPRPSPPLGSVDGMGAPLAGERGAQARLGGGQAPHRLETRVADVTTLALDGALVHIDPDRRAGGQRVLRLEQYAPPLEWLQQLAIRARGGAIKVSPAGNFGGKFPEAEVELISLNGECKEATIWLGELRDAAPWRATVLPAGATIAGHPLDAPTDVRPIGRYLYDPDPAVVRAGLVDLVCRDLGLWRLDSAEEYLSSDAPAASPFAAPFEVLEVVPNNAKTIRAAIRSRCWGEVEIKCRHVKVDADAERRRLPLEGEGAGVLLFARLESRTRAVLARRVDLGRSSPEPRPR